MIQPRHIVLSALLAAVTTTSAYSAIVYWDGDGIDVVGGGAGTWDTSATRWSPTIDGSIYQPWNNDNNDDAVFGGTGGAVTVATPITAASLTFTSGGYNLSGSPAPVLSSNTGTLTLDAQTGITVLNLQYNAAITTIIKNGSGLLSTGLSQTGFAGKWQVNGGILSLPGDLRLGVVPTALVPDQVTLDGGFLRTSTATVTFNANRGIVLGLNGGGFDSNHTGILSWNGPIAGVLGGSFTKRGSGNVALTNNANSYDGITAVNAGRLTVGAANALGNTVGDTQVAAGAGLVFDGATTNFTIAELIQVAGVGVGTDGGAIAVLNNANVTFTGPITLSSDAALAVAGTATANFSTTVNSSADQTLTLQAEALTTGGGGTISGAVSLGFGGLTKSGSGKWTLAGANTYFGPTTITEGTLVVAGSISGTSAVEVIGTLGGGGSMVLGNGGSVSVLLGGKISPGGGVGTLSLALSGGGFLDLTSSITPGNSQALIFELGAPGASDKVSLLGGALSLGTNFLEFDDFVLTAVGGFVPEADYVLFDGSLPILGTLGPNRNGTINGFLAEIQIGDSGRDIILHVVPEPSCAMAMIGAMAPLIGFRRRRS